MAQASEYFELGFASFYQGAVKPFKNKSQHESVNALLVGAGAADISIAMASNYAAGGRSVPGIYRENLASLSDAALAERLDYIGIRDYGPMCAALIKLVNHARMPEGQRVQLRESLPKYGRLPFIRGVARAVACMNRAYRLSAFEMAALASFSGGGGSAIPAKPIPQSEAATALPCPQMPMADKRPSGGLRGHEWIMDYVPRDAVMKNDWLSEPFSVTVETSSFPVDMSQDLPRLICLLTPMVKGNPIEGFSVEEFLDMMGE